MFDFLEGFEKRMGFAAVVDSIVNRKNTNMEIEGWFQGEELDNLFFTLLVYIMEQTLNENDECTLENIARFLDDILPVYQKKWPFDQVMRLAEYMVKDILQNKGTVKNYGIMDYGRQWHDIQVRLISDKITADNKIIYQLTDQGYDFLFRTKEIDKEMDFKLEQLKLKMLLKRKNYKHALKQSRDLINMLRQKKREMESFIDRVRQNIHTIDRGEHERLLLETYNLIDEEYEDMLEMKEAVVKDEDRIGREIEESGYSDETMNNALYNLNLIKRNIQIVIGEQRNLIGKRFNMNDIYEETIRNSFYASVVKRFDFQKEIMDEMEKVNSKNVSNLWKLMTPLCMPSLDKKMNLSLIYQNQGKLRENEEEDHVVEEEVLEEDLQAADREISNAMNFRVIERIFKFAGERGTSFTFSQFYEHIVEKTQRIHQYTENKRIFLILLKLYDYGVIDIESWKKHSNEDMIPDTNGEFDLSWCLRQMEDRYPDFYGVEQLVFEKKDFIFHAVLEDTVGAEVLYSTIEMADIEIIPKIRSEVGQDVETGISDI
ncbi:hypothetical protein [Robinsoniella peoriensis]|uniref:Replicative DNA helicase n=1 Tax=Robinsoniella peoriensis TaxID=180332 RepID=A0A4U8QA61_9FIRM|nr:hypothetical protein [Robinsoniella peoriensis]TLD01900.1 hypothetical protein DSM106044_01270 [Robinsoniella peoriensis]